jgi:hypothetical protein
MQELWIIKAELTLLVQFLPRPTATYEVGRDQYDIVSYLRAQNLLIFVSLNGFNLVFGFGYSGDQHLHLRVRYLLCRS